MRIFSLGIHRGKPRRGEHHARLGIITRRNMRRGISYRALLFIDGYRAVERPMPPSTHVIARSYSLTRSHGQVQRHGYVVGRFRPTAAHELPIQLAHIGVRLRSKLHGVVQLDDRILIILVEKHVHGILRLIERVRSIARPARFTPLNLEGRAGKARKRCGCVASGISVGHAHTVDFDTGAAG